MSTDSSDTSFEKFSAELVVDQDLAAFFYSVRERDITSKVVVERLRAVGGFADVYEGVFREYGDEPGSTIDGSGQQAPTGGESKVAIKRFRIFANPGSMTTVSKTHRDILLSIMVHHSQGYCPRVESMEGP